MSHEKQNYVFSSTFFKQIYALAYGNIIDCNNISDQDQGIFCFVPGDVNVLYLRLRQPIRSSEMCNQNGGCLQTMI